MSHVDRWQRNGRFSLILVTFVASTFVACSDPIIEPPPPFDASVIDADAVLFDAAGDRSVRTDIPDLPRTDFTVELPYMGEEKQVVLMVRADPKSLDLHFSIDTTSSFIEEIDRIQSGLRGEIVPALSERVSDLAVGVSRFEDFGREPFGGSDDQPFELLSGLTTDLDIAASAIARLDQPLGNGGDGPESGYEALYQVATGEGLTDFIPRFEGTGEGVGFRPASLRIVVHATDAPFHPSSDYPFPTHGRDDVIDALEEGQIRVIGIATSELARPQLEDLALESGAFSTDDCNTGLNGQARAPRSDGRCPLVYDVRADGSGLSDAVANGILTFFDTIAWGEVYARSEDRLGFVSRIVTTSDALSTQDLRPTDGIDDTYVNVAAGTELGFEAIFQNTVLRPTDYPQEFIVILSVLGDGEILQTLSVRVVVPPVEPTNVDAGVDAMPDAGVDAMLDAGVDAMPDAGVDAMPDAGVDAMPDVMPDAIPDAMPDATDTDAG